MANAVRFTGPGGVIALGAEVSSADLRIWVRDEGTGIAEADQGRIFDRFARASHGVAANDPGAGLAIVSAIAEAHHGRVELQSEPGRGSTFTIVVPRSPTPPGAPWPPS